MARNLGLIYEEIESCERSRALDDDRCYEMLILWKKKQKGKGKVWDLASAIYKAGLDGIVEKSMGRSF